MLRFVSQPGAVVYPFQAMMLPGVSTAVFKDPHGQGLLIDKVGNLFAADVASLFFWNLNTLTVEGNNLLAIPTATEEMKDSKALRAR
jgi:hypothetical protein